MGAMAYDFEQLISLQVLMSVCIGPRDPGPMNFFHWIRFRLELRFQR